MDNQTILAIGIFLVIYAVIVSEKIHRTITAMVGGILMVVLGIVDQETAIHHIDFNTLGLLVGMMILVSITGESGVFKFLAIKAAKLAKGKPILILIYLSVVTAVLSALLDNVTTVMLIVPVTFSIARQLNISPIPFLISEIITSNIGGTATLIGDPPNIMIGSAVPELDFMAFIYNLAPIAIAVMAVTMVLLVLIYRKDMKADPERQKKVMQLREQDELKDVKLLIKSLAVLALTIVAFAFHGVLHVESATVALSGAFLLLLLTGEHYLEEALDAVEWSTIFFFVGLFVLVSGLIETGVISMLAEKAIEATGGDLAAMSMLILWMSAITSAFVDNIPFVATMIPMIKEMGALGITDLEPLWWSLALGACLGGNGTLIGASANVIVSGLANKEGYKITFFGFMKIAFPLMLLSIAMSSVYVWWHYLM